jgi:hypothetical protein
MAYSSHEHGSHAESIIQSVSIIDYKTKMVSIPINTLITTYAYACSLFNCLSFIWQFLNYYPMMPTPIT